MCYCVTEKLYSCTGDHSSEMLARLVADHLLNEETGHRLAKLFKALSDPTRLQIIGLLAHAEMCVGDICLAVGKSQPATSHHLRILREDNLVKIRRDGQHVLYTLADDHIHTLFHQGLDHVTE